MMFYMEDNQRMKIFNSIIYRIPEESQDKLHLVMKGAKLRLLINIFISFHFKIYLCVFNVDNIVYASCYDDLQLSVIS